MDNVTSMKSVFGLLFLVKCSVCCSIRDDVDDDSNGPKGHAIWAINFGGDGTMVVGACVCCWIVLRIVIEIGKSSTTIVPLNFDIQ